MRHSNYLELKERIRGHTHLEVGDRLEHACESDSSHACDHSVPLEERVFKHLSHR